MLPIYRLNEYLNGNDHFHLARSARDASQTLIPHGHAFAEIFWVTGQSCVHTVNGEPIELAPGELAVIHAGDEHTLWASRPGTWIIYNIAFPEEDLQAMIARHPRAQALFGRHKSGTISQRFGASQVDYLESCFEHLLVLPRDALALDWLLLSLALNLLPQPDIELPPEAPSWLRRACQLIAKPEHFALGPVEMARLAQRSPEHLARTVRHWLGCSPGDLITRLRLHHARHQLQSTNAPIKTIVENCGLRNLSHFYRMFEAEFGQPPAAWRREHGGNQPM
jgi:AraC family cel operon transcriptional repressor